MQQARAKADGRALAAAGELIQQSKEQRNLLREERRNMERNFDFILTTIGEIGSNEDQFPDCDVWPKRPNTAQQDVELGIKPYLHRKSSATSADAASASPAPSPAAAAVAAGRSPISEPQSRASRQVSDQSGLSAVSEDETVASMEASLPSFSFLDRSLSSRRRRSLIQRQLRLSLGVEMGEELGREELGGEDGVQDKTYSVPSNVSFGDSIKHARLAQHLRQRKRLALATDETIHAYVCSSPFFAFVSQDPTADCVILTDKRLLKLEDGKVVHNIPTDKIVEVTQQKTSFLRWSRLVLTVRRPALSASRSSHSSSRLGTGKSKKNKKSPSSKSFKGGNSPPRGSLYGDAGEDEGKEMHDDDEDDNADEDEEEEEERVESVGVWGENVCKFFWLMVKLELASLHGLSPVEAEQDIVASMPESTNLLPKARQAARSFLMHRSNTVLLADQNLEEMSSLNLMYSFVASNTQWLCFLAYVLNLIFNPSFLAFVTVYVIFVYGMVEYPSAGRGLWVWCVCYSSFLIIIKFTFQLDPFCTEGNSRHFSLQPNPLCAPPGAEQTTPASNDFWWQPDALLGLYKLQSSTQSFTLLVIWDLACIVLVAWHRAVMMEEGIWLTPLRELVKPQQIPLSLLAEAQAAATPEAHQQQQQQQQQQQPPYTGDDSQSDGQVSLRMAGVKLSSLYRLRLASRIASRHSSQRGTPLHLSRSNTPQPQQQQQRRQHAEMGRGSQGRPCEDEKANAAASNPDLVAAGEAQPLRSQPATATFKKATHTKFLFDFKEGAGTAGEALDKGEEEGEGQEAADDPAGKHKARSGGKRAAASGGGRISRVRAKLLRAVAKAKNAVPKEILGYYDKVIAANDLAREDESDSEESETEDDYDSSAQDEHRPRQVPHANDMGGQDGAFGGGGRLLGGEVGPGAVQTGGGGGKGGEEQRLDKLFRKIPKTARASAVEKDYRSVLRKEGADLYLWLFISELISAFYLVLGYSSFAVNSTSGAASSAATVILQENLFSIDLVTTLFVQIAFIILDRAVYLKRSLSWKLLLQYVTAAYWSNKIFFQWPIDSRIGFFSNPSLIFFFIIKVVYFSASGLQLHWGYIPRIHTPLQALTCKPSIVRGYIFALYRAIPFVFELRTLMDWVFTPTSLDLWETLKLEDVYANLYLVSCRILWKKGVQRGRVQLLYSKILSGGLIFLGLLLVILGPVLLFSAANPATKPNNVLNAQLSVSLISGAGNRYPLCSISGLASLSEISDSEYAQMKSRSLVVDDAQEHIQRVQFVTYSDNYYKPTTPMSASLRQQLNQTDPAIAFFAVASYSFTRPGPPDDQTITGTTTSSALSRELMRDILQTVTASDQRSSFEIPALFPAYLRLPQSGAAVVLSSGSAPATLTLTADQWWEISQLDPEDGTSKGARMVTVSNPLWSGVLATTGVSYSIVAVYTIVFVTVGRLVRTFFSDMMRDIMFRDTHNMGYLIMFCEGIYISRHRRRFHTEEELYRRLIWVYRNPKLLARLTRRQEGFAAAAGPGQIWF